jgi:hypothetical protein
MKLFNKKKNLLYPRAYWSSQADVEKAELVESVAECVTEPT